MCLVGPCKPCPWPRGRGLRLPAHPQPLLVPLQPSRPPLGSRIGKPDRPPPSPSSPGPSAAFAGAPPAVPLRPGVEDRQGGLVGMITFIGRSMGGVVNVLFNSGRKSIDQVLRNVLPFMAFVTMLIGIINATGVGTVLAHLLEPLAGNVFG